jgi:hypothetical protein
MPVDGFNVCIALVILFAQAQKAARSQTTETKFA